MSTTVAFLAECQGSATLDEQRASLDHDDLVVVAGKQGFNKLADLLAKHGIRLRPGDRVKLHDLSCVELATTTLVRVMARMLRLGVTLEIVSAGLTIAPEGADGLHALLKALDGHNRHLHGIKARPAGRRGRKFVLTADRLPDIKAMLDQPGATTGSVAQELGVARSTLFNFLDRHDPSRGDSREAQP